MNQQGGLWYRGGSDPLLSSRGSVDGGRGDRPAHQGQARLLRRGRLDTSPLAGMLAGVVLGATCWLVVLWVVGVLR